MSCSSSQRQSKHAEQSLELRYMSNPPYDCFKKSQIKPERAMWSLSGILVNFTSNEFDSKKEEEFEDVVSGVSGASRVVGSHRRDDIRGNYVHFS
ncbi:hypothetical protein BUALT_Bualt04G0024700 [Buddleja alternifolia]|uniref:Uncharacterized protein n=1 Tax=Buddleja alternifolia TaxID=168488 RepID=A0AAV6XM22_9LAMI|nr:hypothetical protein BUALT_Bualt04G0024700 [Buddleja alternifolia]